MRRGRLQCRPASASSVRKYGFSSEKPFGKLLAQTCKRLVLGVFSFFCYLFFLFSPLSKEKEKDFLYICKFDARRMEFPRPSKEGSRSLPQRTKQQNMRNYKLWNNIIGWAVWLIASIVFIGTAERAASWWDCGEYISSASQLMVGHPPGAPTFQLLGAIASIFAFGDPAKVGFMVNCMSALCSSFTILFLFWSITMLARKLVFRFNYTTHDAKTKRRILLPDAPDASSWIPSLAQSILIFGSGIVGALAYTFSDSFWFSAVEGEVYAMSSFFTAVTFWAILRWETVADQPHNLRWIILIAFMIGLAIGVHLLNLLVIPAIVFVIYYKKFQPSRKRFWISILLSVLILGLTLWVIIPWTVKLAGYIELFCVNSLGMPFNIGTILFFLILIAALVFGLRYAQKHQRVILHTSLLCLCFLLIGYSTFITLVIRANANVPLNQGEVKNAISLLSYLNRDQYGSTPLVYGQFYNAQLIEVEEANPQYVRDDSTGRYEQAGYSSQKLTYDPDHCGLFPRMWSSMQSGGRPCVTYNKIWSGHDGNERPSLGENLRYLWKYQLGWMYGRYFMWNFVGRQNDIMGRGYNTDGSIDVLHGNWISGIKFIDEMRLGPQDNLPRYLKENPARNTFYFLPLILGLIGLFVQSRYDNRNSFIVFLLFFMTGLAIVLYLNQPSTEPRERDYAVVGSFYAFAIWIGLGVAGLSHALNKWLKKKPETVKAVTYTCLSVVCLLAVPTLMAQQGWDDHDRSHRTSARDFGRNNLESCEPNAILVSDGDNDTYPLWYNLYVEKVRPDVRLVNSMLAHSSWHIQPLFRKIYESEPFNLSISSKNYGGGKNEHVYIQDQISSSLEAKDVLDFINSDNPQSKLRAMDGHTISFSPGRHLKLTIDKERMRASGLYTEEEIARTPDVLRWDLSGDGLSKSDLILLDLVANNLYDRPIYFVSPYSHNSFLPAMEQSQVEGMVYRFVPFKNDNRFALGGGSNGIDTKRTFDLLVNKFSWGEINSGKEKLDPETRAWSEQARHQYATLAMGLIAENKTDSAIIALDKGLYFFPDQVLEYTQHTLLYADAYFRCGAKEKGEAILNSVADNYIQRLMYYNSFRRPKFQRGLRGEIQETINTLGSTYYIAQQYGIKEVADKLSLVFDQHGIQR